MKATREMDARPAVDRARTEHPSAARKTKLRAKWLVVLGVLGAAAWLGLAADEGVVPSTEDAFGEIDPRPSVPESCRLHGDEAVTHARALEQAASARWERVPFALDEAPRALLQMSEAELCYGALNREGRVRSANKRREYETEIERRFARARLALRVAARAGQHARARKQIAILRALSSRAPDGVRAYRAELERLDHAYAARELEATEEAER